MHHRDGTLLARYPHVERADRQELTGPVRPASSRYSNAPTRTSRLASPIDGKDRLISSRALTNFPIVIVATTTTSAALADWREQIGILIAIAGLVGACDRRACCFWSCASFRSSTVRRSSG